MSAPRSPGYYPAPDGRGEQWWNGVAWSESRRGAGSAVRSNISPVGTNITPVHSNITPTDYAPPRHTQAAGQNLPPSPYAARPGAPRQQSISAASPVGAIVLAAVSIFAHILSPIALIAGVVAYRRAGRAGTSRIGAVVAIVMSLFALVLGIAQVVPSLMGVLDS